MAARDDAGSNYGRPGGSQNSGTYNGGVAGGGGGGFAGGGGGRNGGFNSSTGLRTGTSFNGNTAFGPAGGMANSYTTRRSGDAPNRPTTGNLLGGVSLGGLAKSLADIFTGYSSPPTQTVGTTPKVASPTTQPPLPTYNPPPTTQPPLPTYEVPPEVVPAPASYSPPDYSPTLLRAYQSAYGPEGYAFAGLGGVNRVVNSISNYNSQNGYGGGVSDAFNRAYGRR